jgi:nascent polypeptide-associated complex subunit alpha
MFGGGGMNPRKMQQMMKQMGIDVDELDAEEVVIRTADEEYVFDSPQVTKMDAQGQETFQVVGDYDVREAGAGGVSDDATPVESGDAADESAGAIPDSDVQIVAQRAGVSEDDARAALEDEDGDLAAAISRLE